MQIIFLLQENASLLFLHLESLIHFFFHNLNNFWDINWIYFFFLDIQNIKSNFRIIFLKRFPIISFWWIIYFFPVMFIYKWINIWSSFCMGFNATVAAYWKLLSIYQLYHLPWYLERSGSNSSSTPSFASFWDVSFTLQLPKCIAHSSSVSFEEIKLIAIVN